MGIDVRDASEYFRGLLLLVAKDRKIAAAERVLMMRVGKALGFEKEFCETAISEVLENTFIAEDPPGFSTPALAMKFIKDGLTVAGVDDETHGFEESWLEATAKKNGLDAAWVHREKKAVVHRGKDPGARLEIDDLR